MINCAQDLNVDMRRPITFILHMEDHLIPEKSQGYESPIKKVAEPAVFKFIFPCHYCSSLL